MARVTVEDCVDKVANHFELVGLSIFPYSNWTALRPHSNSFVSGVFCDRGHLGRGTHNPI